MDEMMVPIFGMLFGIGGPLAAVIVWMVLSYRRRRRVVELYHAERMAAIERGMELPELPLDLIEGGSPRRRRSALLPGLVWFFIGLALVIGSMTLHDRDEMPLFVGLVPLGVGLAYLIYYFLEGRALEQKWLEHDLAGRPKNASL